MTYSIAARDPQTGELGVAVQSHFFAVGRVVSFVRSGVGAVATQAFAEIGYGHWGLDLMEGGASAERAMAELLDADGAASSRQLGFVDGRGGVSAHTGETCVAAAGHVVGQEVAVQGNMLASPTAWPAMLRAYEQHGGDLAERLLAALDAGEDAGGDIRGRQSASILVASTEPRDRPWEAVVVDCRIDDHDDPLAELRRLVPLSRFYTRLLALFSEAGVLGGELSVDQAALDRALDDLAVGQEILGGNQEATFWRAVLLARMDRVSDAREHFEAAFAVRPQLAEFLERAAPLIFEGDHRDVLRAVGPGAQGET